MRGKTALLVLAGAGLIVLLVVLKQSLSTAPAADEPVAKREEAQPTDKPVPDQSSRDSKIVAPVVRAADAGVDAVVETQDDSKPILDPRTGKPPGAATWDVLGQQAEAVAPLVRDCIAKASGKKDGDIVVMHIIAPKDRSAVIESTDLDFDKTTVDNPALAECIQKTALAMRFPFIEGSDPIAARRKVTIQNGQITWYGVTEFSYLRK